jgi:hypothetical protein
LPGEAELQPDQEPENARREEEQEGGGDVEIADDGVVDVADDAPAPRPLPDRFERLEFPVRARQRVWQGHLVRIGLRSRRHFMLIR